MKIYNYEIDFIPTGYKNYVQIEFINDIIPKGFTLYHSCCAFRLHNLDSRIEEIKAGLRNAILGKFIEKKITELNIPDGITINYSYTHSIYITDKDEKINIRISDHPTGSCDYEEIYINWTVGEIFRTVKAQLSSIII